MNYIDSAWDEGNNCSKFRSEETADKVRTKIEKIESTSDEKLTCPIDCSENNQLIEKYGYIYYLIVNFEGHRQIDDFYWNW